MTEINVKSGNDLMNQVAEGLKKVVLEKLQVLAGFKRVQEDYQRAAKAYQALTGEVLLPEGQKQRGRKAGSTKPAEDTLLANTQTSGKSLAGKERYRIYLQALVDHGPATGADLWRATGSLGNSGSAFQAMARLKAKGYVNGKKLSMGVLYNILPKGVKYLAQLTKNDNPAESEPLKPLVIDTGNTKDTRSANTQTGVQIALKGLASAGKPMKPAELSDYLQIKDQHTRKKIGIALTELRNKGFATAEKNGDGGAYYAITSEGMNKVVASLQ
jgi:DNA-binding PadR family transcriptional regulator